MQPWSATLNVSVQFAVKARKQAQTARVQLEQAKMRMKTAKSDRMGQAQVELQESEEAYNNALSDATHKMKLVVDSVRF